MFAGRWWHLILHSVSTWSEAQTHHVFGCRWPTEIRVDNESSKFCQTFTVFQSFRWKYIVKDQLFLQKICVFFDLCSFWKDFWIVMVRIVEIRPATIHNFAAELPAPISGIEGISDQFRFRVQLNFCNNNWSKQSQTNTNFRGDLRSEITCGLRDM